MDELMTFSFDKGTSEVTFNSDNDRPLHMLDVADGTERVHVVGQSILMENPAQQTVTLTSWPLQLGPNKTLPGKLVAVYPKHFFILSPFKLTRYAFPEGEAVATVERDFTQDKVFAVSPGKIVVATGTTLCLWSVTDKGADRVKEWVMPGQFRRGIAQIMGAQRVSDVVALVERIGLVQLNQFSHRIFYFHPDLAEPALVQVCTTPCLFTLNSTFVRVSSGLHQTAGNRFVLVQRDMSEYKPVKDDFPKEKELSEEQVPSIGSRCVFIPPDKRVPYAVKGVEAQGRCWVLRYGPADAKEEPLDGQFFVYDMGPEQQHSVEMPSDFKGGLRLIGDDQFLTFRGPECGRASMVSVGYLKEWTIDCRALGPKVTRCEIVDAGANEEAVVALVRYWSRYDNQERYCLYALPGEGRSGAVATSDHRPRRKSREVLPGPVESEEAKPSRPYLGKGKIVIAVLAALVVTYCLIRIWTREGKAAKSPPAPTPIPTPTPAPLPPRPLPGPPVRRPKGKSFIKG